MKITFQGKEYIKTSIVCSENYVTVGYTNIDREVLYFQVDFLLEYDNSYNPDDFQISFLAKKDVLENDIYQVYDRGLDRRIGWIFPVVALDSTEHEYAVNEHFIKYANVVKAKIFIDAGDDVFTPVPELFGKDNFSFCDFFHDSTVILIISKVTLGGTEFNIRDWLPSLSISGYCPLTRIDPKGLMPLGSKPADNRLYIKKIATELQGHSFINLVYSELIPFEKHPLLFFFYFYQIIEIMLTLVFQVEQSLLFAELRQPVADGDVVKTKDVMEKVGRVNSEKYRFKQLTEIYSTCHIGNDELKDACNELLMSVNKDAGNSLSEAIYKVRNFLFHQYHSTSGTVENELIKVNCHMLEYLCDLCSSITLRR